MARTIEETRVWHRAYHHRNKAKRNANSRAWHVKNPGGSRKHELMRNFGITPEQYGTQLARQGNKCAICQTDKCPTGRNFAVDHDHATGIIRGLLCSPCNNNLGHFEKARDSSAVQSYLEEPPWKSPSSISKRTA